MTAPGGPEVLRAVVRPNHQPGPGEVVVRSAVVGVNRADLFIRSGEWKIAGALPYVPGLEVAGVVDRCGPGVDELSPGDAVITMMQRLGGIHGTRAGGYQSHVLVPADTVVPVPAELDVVTAGALGLPAVTALAAVAQLGPLSDKRVLVQGGSSAVGSMALQMLAAAGAYPIGTGTRPEKFAFMQEAGARETIDTRDAGWPDAVSGVDAVIELVGAATFAASVSLLAVGGQLVFVGGTSGGELSFSGWDLMKPVTLTGYSSETLTRAQLLVAMQELAALVGRGALRVLRLSEFTLAEAAAAHRAMEAGEVAGRVVLRA
jgi:NADPH2:quinone reductase